jgi:ribose 5-phosphate isomerase B
MAIYIGSDHRGFQLKNSLVEFLRAQGYEVFDLGNNQYDENDDYPDFAQLVARKVSTASAELRGLEADQRRNREVRGILLCGSGVGVDIAANKFQGIRSALVFNKKQAFLSRNDDDTNVLSLAADFIKEEEAKEIIEIWLQTPFSGEERHKRRIAKIEKLENGEIGG